MFGNIYFRNCFPDGPYVVLVFLKHSFGHIYYCFIILIDFYVITLSDSENITHKNKYKKIELTISYFIITINI